jgi:hypothetical protein
VRGRSRLMCANGTPCCTAAGRFCRPAFLDVSCLNFAAPEHAAIFLLRQLIPHPSPASVDVAMLRPGRPRVAAAR